MKKLGALAVGLLLFVPAFTFAQTDTTSSLIAYYTQLIQTLENELQQLIAARAPQNAIIPTAQVAATATVATVPAPTPLTPTQKLEATMQQLNTQETSICNAAPTAQGDERATLQAECTSDQNEYGADQKQLDDMEGITISTSTTPTQNPALSNSENEISSLQSQVQTCDASMDSDSGVALGRAAVEQQGLATQCGALSSELTTFLDEQGVILNGGVMTTTCSNEIASLEAQILPLEETTGDGFLTSGESSSIAEAQAQEAIETAQQEAAPLEQQVQQNLYQCQP